MPAPGRLMHLKVYVGCSLTHAPKDFRDKVESLKEHLRSFVSVLDFVGLTTGTSADVYNHDIHKCVATSDLFIAIGDFPSIGLGWELGKQVECQKGRTILAVHEDTKLTRLALGAAEVHSFVTVSRYTDLLDLIPEILQVLEEVHQKKMCDQDVVQEIDSLSLDQTPYFPAFAAGVEGDSQGWMFSLLVA